MEKPGNIAHVPNLSQPTKPGLLKRLFSANQNVMGGEGNESVKQELRELERIGEEIEEDLDKLVAAIPPKLSFIKIAFAVNGGRRMEGPVTLTVGQKTTASLDGFDQNGAVWTGPIPAPTWSIDNAAFDSIAPDVAIPANEDLASLAAGVANLTASVTTAEGKALTDTEVVTNVAQVLVLSSIKINFSTPA
jgi:hypothetical protein